jgi:Protein kinase domain
MVRHGGRVTIHRSSVIGGESYEIAAATSPWSLRRSWNALFHHHQNKHSNKANTTGTMATRNSERGRGKEKKRGEGGAKKDGREVGGGAAGGESNDDEDDADDLLWHSENLPRECRPRVLWVGGSGSVRAGALFGGVSGGDHSPSQSQAPGKSARTSSSSSLRRVSSPPGDFAAGVSGVSGVASQQGHPPPAVIVRRQNRYVVGRQVGTGSFGCVWSATLEGRENDRRALKQMEFHEPARAKKALRELRLLRFVKHENIIGMTDVLCVPPGPGFDYLYLVTELMQTDLRRVLRTGARLSAEHVRLFVYQILRGLKYLHSAGIVHRDLKVR